MSALAVFVAAFAVAQAPAASSSPADGTRGGSCYGNGTCNAGLGCVDNVCKSVDGTEGHACYGNNTCNTGLSCDHDVCKSAKAPPAATTTATTAAPAPAATPAAKIRVLVLNLQAVEVPAADATILNGSVAGALHKIDALEVLTQEDLKQLTNVAADKQAMGCDSSSCLAEIAGAMGARSVVYGKVGKLGELWVVQLNLFDSEQAKPIGREEAKSASIEAIPSQLSTSSTSLVRSLVPSAPAAAAPALSSDTAKKFAAVRASRDKVTLADVGRTGVVAGGLVSLVALTSYAYSIVPVPCPAAELRDFPGDTCQQIGDGRVVFYAFTALFSLPVLAISGVLWFASVIVDADVDDADAALAKSLGDAGRVDLQKRYADIQSARQWNGYMRQSGVGLMVAGGTLLFLGVIDYGNTDGNLASGTFLIHTGIGTAAFLGGGGLLVWGLLRGVDENRDENAFAASLGGEPTEAGAH